MPPKKKRGRRKGATRTSPRGQAAQEAQSVLKQRLKPKQLAARQQPAKGAGELQVGDRVQADFMVDGELEESEGVVRGRQGREYSVRFDDASEWTIGRDKLRRARSQRSTKKDDGEGGRAREDRIEEEEEEEEEEDDDEGLWGQKVYPCR